MIDLCGGTCFILDHCGNYAAHYPNWKQWHDDIANIADHPNVNCKISGICKTVKPGENQVKELERAVKHCVSSFGTDRVMFGGDWPVCNNTSSFAGWVATVKGILHDWSQEDLKKLFHDNAVDFYKLT